jgi:hypothetical protein
VSLKNAGRIIDYRQQALIRFELSTALASQSDHSAAALGFACKQDNAR